MSDLKNKIQKFSKGDFRQVRPEVEFEETNLVLIIGEGEVYRGGLQIKSKNESKVRGLIYPSSFRVRFKEQGFEGNPARIEFTYDGRGLKPGHVERGKFTVVCSGGEYELSFTAIIEKPYIMTAYGKVQSTDDFRKLAIKDYSEAGRLFRSKSFYEILKYENERIFYLYDNMRKWSLGEQAMEEFLVGIKQKECIFLTLAGEGMLFEDIHESTKGIISVMKNTWGFMPVQIRAKGRFIKVLKSEITTEDFVGNTLEVEYLVRPEYLHGGRNYGSIHFITPYEELTYEVEVLQSMDYHENHHVPELLCAQTLKEYISYVAGRKELKAWVDSAEERIATLRKLDPNSELYQLLQAHIYIKGRKMEEAKWNLENFNYNRFAIGKDPIINCYYLYLTALIRGKSNHTERVLDEIGKTYMRYQDSWMLLEMLIHLDRRYRNPYKKLEVLEQQFDFNCHQVMFYLEAYQCYQEKPILLKKLGRFEIQVLEFAAKYRLMTKELALYVSNFASQQKSFSESLFRILVRIYDMYRERMILNTICTLLIKGNKNQRKYFIWYQRSVEAGLKIAQLYEYYMETLDTESVRGALPKSIFLYFMHGNSLDYKKAAFLYANLLTYEVGGEDMFLSYREQMVTFTWDQLLKRHVTEHLRVLYKRFCTKEEMDDVRMEAMRDICFAYGVSTKVTGMNYVLVIEKDGQVRQKVPYEHNGDTIICLYDKESRIVWESVLGRYYTDSIPYETKRLFYEPRFLDMCKKYAEDEGKRQEFRAQEELSLDNILDKGLDAFDEEEVFRFCSRQVRDANYKEDERLTFLGFELFKRGQYDKATLMYLANWYCGATKDMKKLWGVIKEYEIPAYKIGERIITQMVFSEHLFDEEKIFEDYYLSDNAYFRLKQAYLAYVSKEYLVRGREVKRCVFDIIANECEQGEELTDICKVALLKYFSQCKFTADYEPVLHQVLREMCEKQIVFPFYMNYEETWLRELQLYDKAMLFYKGEPGSSVKLYYKMKRGGREELGYRTETLLPIFENLYVKQYVLYEDEYVSYYFQETKGKSVKTTEKSVLNGQCGSKVGKYGRLNAMIRMSPEERGRVMATFAEDELMAEKMFRIY